MCVKRLSLHGNYIAWISKEPSIIRIRLNDLYGTQPVQNCSFLRHPVNHQFAAIIPLLIETSGESSILYENKYKLRSTQKNGSY